MMTAAGPVVLPLTETVSGFFPAELISLALVGILMAC
jgi:hypothetical protein